MQAEHFFFAVSCSSPLQVCVWFAARFQSGTTEMATVFEAAACSDVQPAFAARHQPLRHKGQRMATLTYERRHLFSCCTVGSSWLSQILMFGDRLFYRDWWNANTIDAYWRLWNLPVHYWMVSKGGSFLTERDGARGSATGGSNVYLFFPYNYARRRVLKDQRHSNVGCNTSHSSTSHGAALIVSVCRLRYPNVQNSIGGGAGVSALWTPASDVVEERCCDRPACLAQGRDIHACFVRPRPWHNTRSCSSCKP